MTVAEIFRRRCQRLSDESLQYTEFQLHEWGRWRRAPLDKQPRMPTAEAIDRLIAVMPVDLRDLLVLKYVKRLPVTVIAAAHEVGRQSVARKLKGAVAYILGAIGK